jgi:hypothetical protein
MPCVGAGTTHGAGLQTDGVLHGRMRGVNNGKQEVIITCTSWIEGIRYTSPRSSPPAWRKKET